MAIVSFIEQLRRLAAEQPPRTAVTCGAESVTYAELVDRIDDLACELQAHGVGEGRMVTIALPNSIDWFVSFGAAWRLGATPQPISSRLPAREIEAIVELADPAAVIGVPDATFPGRVCLPIGHRAPRRPADCVLADMTSREWKAPTSGGSTGRPKLIVSGDPAAMDDQVPSGGVLRTISSGVVMRALGCSGKGLILGRCARLGGARETMHP